MTRTALHAEATAFFDDFVSAFARFDGKLIASRYLAPHLAMHADGSSDLFAEQQEIGAYFPQEPSGLRSYFRPS